MLAPFLHLTKAQIVERGSALGVPFGETWSCYLGGAQHCGRCGTCVERREAFELAGIADPTRVRRPGAGVSFTIAKRFEFSASHVLTLVPDDHKCRRLHGHNYEVEVICAADELDERAMVVDYFDLDPAKRFIDDTIDHRHLNDVVPGEPTAERLAQWLFDELTTVLDDAVAARLVAVRVHETPKTWAEYRPT